MHFKEFLIVIWASTLLGMTGYLLFAEKLAAWGASLVILSGAFFLLLVLNVDVISSFAASWGEQAQIRVEMNRLREDVFAKVEFVRKLGEEMARFAAHTVSTAGRYVGDDHQEQMLRERERIRSMMKSLGSEDAKIAEVLDQIDNAVANDLKAKVVGAVGRTGISDHKTYERLVTDLRDQLLTYNAPESHGTIVDFLKTRKAYDESVEQALRRLDLFLREKHL